MERGPSGSPFLEIINILTQLKCLQLGKKRRSHFFDKLQIRAAGKFSRPRGVCAAGQEEKNGEF